MDPLPFDIEVARREPQRVRHEGGLEAEYVVVLPDNYVAVKWRDDFRFMYSPSQFDTLRIAPRTRKVKIRAWHGNAYNDDLMLGTQSSAYFNDPGWIAECEIEVPSKG